MTDRKSRISYLVNIKAYLSRLEKITGRTITREDLEAVETFDKIKKFPKKYSHYPLNKYEIRFDDINKHMLDDFIHTLYQSNSGQIYIWVEDVDACGLLKLSSIQSVDFSFVFVHDLSLQVLSFTTVDLEERLLLDIDLDENNLPTLLTIEYQGKNWSKVKSPIFTELTEREITD